MEQFTRPLDLPGWERRSIYGWDDYEGSLYAQLWANDSTNRDHPDVWITPPRWPRTDSFAVLATWIAEAAGCSFEDADEAIARTWVPRAATG
jgi:hypothetical protein